VAGTVIVDGNNAMGAAADGWWRNPPAAVRRLLARLQCYARTAADPVAVVLVLDVPQPDLPEGEVDGVTVRYATRRGRDAADDRIRELLDEGFEEPVVVATSDRALAADVRSQGAEVVGARTFLDRLDKAGC
jgi:predicted RNA-binding protein with PIN domain